MLFEKSTGNNTNICVSKIPKKFTNFGKKKVSIFPVFVFFSPPPLLKGKIDGNKCIPFKHRILPSRQIK